MKNDYRIRLDWLIHWIRSTSLLADGIVVVPTRSKANAICSHQEIHQREWSNVGLAMGKQTAESSEMYLICRCRLNWPNRK
jgi:hypothetical protein